ncbi:wall-associated receptor kinase 2-like, partial [Trifolium medium]|nr:wall-associated receptor kinase 2-like [Trifolium medium]
MHMDETIIVSSIIDKLPPSWKDFKKSLKHKKEDISLEQLGTYLRLEEEYRKQDDTKNKTAQEKVHVMEEGNSSKNSKKRNRDFNKSHEDHNGNNNNNKTKKRKGSCYYCGKPGHFKHECRFLKKKNKEKNSSASKDNLVAVISELNMIEDADSWWIDSGATRHVCKNKELFKTIDEDGSVLYMGNASTVQVKGKGSVEIEFTSGKKLTLKDVFYVPEVRKNLI